MSEAPAKRAAPLWARVVATGFGVGKARRAPGTWGSLLGVGICLAAVCLYSHGWKDACVNLALQRTECFFTSEMFWIILPVAFISTIIGTAAANSYSKLTGIKDPKEVVVDEIAGQAIALLGIASVEHDLVNSLQVLLEVGLAFLLFRLFDIWKPWPIRRLEKLPGGWGIMADDLAAGAVAGAILAGLIYLRWIPGMG